MNIESKEATIAALKSADLAKQDELYRVISEIKHDYARGYLDCFFSRLTNSIPSDDEEAREELLRVCREYRIWN